MSGALRPGARLGFYEITAVLGAGGMGEVYRAHDTRLGRDVALKVLTEALAKDSEGLARFTREARAVAALNHPHIVTIYSTEEDAGLRFMTMELVEGHSLDQVIPFGGLPLGRLLDVAIALADALSAAHRKQITHRDLKPANVMVASDGRVKVLDFGLARAAEPEGAPRDDEETRQKLTQAGTVLGTMPYMSPEQIEAKPLDPRSDLFSLGIVLYEAAVGVRPFRGDSSPALMSSILKDTPRPLREQRPDIPEAFARLVSRCLEKRPEDRVQTAAEVLAELTAVRRAHESGEAPPSRAAARAPSSSTPRATDLSVAVRPFVSPAKGGDADALAEGLTDDVTAGLARFPHLRVVSKAEGHGAADAPGARYVLEGHVRASGPSVRVSVKLLDSRTGAHLWAESFDRTLQGASVFELQDDLTPRVVSAVADRGGVLARSIGMALRERPCEELTIDELVLRYYLYEIQLKPDEHARLRSAFEAALAREPSHAGGWACLAGLYRHEYMNDVNPLPDPLSRHRQAAERAIELDAVSLDGWREIAAAHFLSRDLAGLRMAAERTIQINPLDRTAGFIGLLLTFAGDRERGLEIVEKTVTPDRQQSGWLQFPPCLDLYAKGAYEPALLLSKRFSIPSPPGLQLLKASIAGKVGRAEEARAALRDVGKISPAFLQREAARAYWSRFVWDEALAEDLLDGFERAVALAGEGATAASSGKASGAERPARPNRELRVAVLPFVAKTPGADTALLADGLTDDVTAGLARFPHLRVVSRPDVERLKAGASDPSSAAARVGARYVLEGHVRAAGPSVRIGVTLVDSETGAHLWADTYDRTLSGTGLFDLQDDVTSRVVATVADKNGILARSMGAALREKPCEELSPDELVLRYYAYEAQPRPDEHARLRSAFEELLRKEPAHANAWACLSTLARHEISQGFNPLPDARARGKDAAARALEADPTCADGWRAMAGEHFAARDLAGLRQAAARVVKVNPLDAQAVAAVGVLLACAGDREHGVAVVRRAMELNPHHPGWYHFGPFLAHCARREYEPAYQEAKRFNMPTWLHAHLCLAAAAANAGRRDEARAAVKDLLALEPRYADASYAREYLTAFIWDAELLDDLVGGYAKALAISADAGSPASGGA